MLLESPPKRLGGAIHAPVRYYPMCSEVDLRWCVHPRGTHANWDMIASLILNDIQSNAGVFPEKNTFIESVKETRIKITRIRHQKLCAFLKPEVAVNHSLSKSRL